jgi:hypothetical protein
MKISMKDSVDGKFDLSNYIIQANGFVPIPMIITEPAVGGFGGALAPVFIKKRPPIIDTVNGKVTVSPVAPDITGCGAMYTVNNSWAAFAARSGTFIKSRIKYRIVAGYANVNVSFYHTFQLTGEQEFKFNIKTIPAYVFAIKRIGRSNWYGGLQYLFTKTDVAMRGDDMPSFVSDKEISSIISQPGAIVEFDNRDNIFTPDNGIKIHVDGSCSNSIFGSDYDYWRINYYTYMYKQIGRKFVGGLRIDGQQALGKPPFYAEPFIDMRGIAAERYQGKADILTEAEARWDVVPRLSVLLYGGMGKAFDEWADFSDATLVYSYGTGFRYLLARKFKLRMGLDVAKGPADQWGYYVVFGSSWLK